MKPSPLRQLTLRLACLTSTDRDWILAQLSSSEREQILVLLAELNSLGLAKQPTVISALLEDMSAGSGHPVPTVAGRDLVVAAHALESPVWVGLLMQALDESQRRTLEFALPIEPVTYRRWSSQWSTRSIPGAWLGALKRYTDGVQHGGNDD